MGLNCALGAALMRPYIQELAKAAPDTFISCYPNAGLPNPMAETGFDEKPEDTSKLLREFVEFWERMLSEGDFAAGCPVVAAAICSDDELNLCGEAGTILGRWCSALTRAFVNDGFSEDDATSLAVMSIAALEGAVLLSRSTRSVDPLRQVGDQLEFLIKAREFVVRNKLGQ